MSGFSDSPHLILYGTLEKSIYGQTRWTDLVQCDVIKNNAAILLRPQKLESRLWAMALQPALVVIPEGVEKIDAGETVPFICLGRLFSEWDDYSGLNTQLRLE
jgi:molybdopterin biosynthesis enzyme